MAAKAERIEARVSRDDRERIEFAAEIEGVSMSSFMVASAVERAEHVIAAQSKTRVPADYFDALVAAIDEAGMAPGLARAVKRSRRRPRIQ